MTRTSDKDEKVGILGAGLMGHSIALNAAWRGIAVTLQGVDEADLARARAGIATKLERFASYGLIDSSDAESIAARIRFVTEVEEALAGSTFAIEAIPERIEMKRRLFARMDEVCGDNVVLASNTSALDPDDIASGMNRPERMLVVHFWNPAHLIPLVEIVAGSRTADYAVDRAMSLMHRMKKRPIKLLKNAAGFIGNRLQYAVLREAEWMLEQGIATKEDIDAAMVYSLGRRYAVTGPFASADLGGLDVFHDVSSYLYPQLADQHHPLEKMSTLVREEHFGVKSGKGFYEWNGNTATEIQERREAFLIECLMKEEAAEQSTET